MSFILRHGTLVACCNQSIGQCDHGKTQLETKSKMSKTDLQSRCDGLLKCVGYGVRNLRARSVAFGRETCSAIAGRLPANDNRTQVIKYGQFVENAQDPGLNPSLKSSPQQKNLLLGWAKYQWGGDRDNLLRGNYYTMQIDATTPTQMNISSGKSSVIDISF